MPFRLIWGNSPSLHIAKPVELVPVMGLKPHALFVSNKRSYNLFVHCFSFVPPHRLNPQWGLVYFAFRSIEWSLSAKCSAELDIGPGNLTKERTYEDIYEATFLVPFATR